MVSSFHILTNSSFATTPPFDAAAEVSLNKLTPQSTVLPEKLTVTQLVNKFPAFYETQLFITVFTTAHEVQGMCDIS
jgi:hypothetical protein